LLSLAGGKSLKSKEKKGLKKKKKQGIEGMKVVLIS